MMPLLDKFGISRPHANKIEATTEAVDMTYSPSGDPDAEDDTPIVTQPDSKRQKFPNSSQNIVWNDTNQNFISPQSVTMPTQFVPRISDPRLAPLPHYNDFCVL